MFDGPFFGRATASLTFQVSATIKKKKWWDQRNRFGMSSEVSSWKLAAVTELWARLGGILLLFEVPLWS